MKVIGITGNTGSGKSIACNLFRKKGFFVIDLDKIGHSIYENLDCFNEIKENIVGDFITDKKIDRKKLGQIVFRDKDSLKTLTEITDKYIYNETKKLIDLANDEIVILDGALIFDSMTMLLCDEIILITSSVEKRINRIVVRDNIDIEYARKRVLSQKDYTNFDYKNKYIIENDGDLSEFESKILTIINKILEKSL